MKFNNLNQLRKALKEIGFNFKKESYSEFSAIKYVYNTKEKDSVVVMTRTEPGISSVLLKKDCQKLKDFLDENKTELAALEQELYNNSAFGTRTVGLYFTEVMVAQS
jgi:hypothetical protein